MNRLQKSISLIAMLAMMLSYSMPAYAFDGKTGDDIVTAAGDVVDDDLYVGARSVTVDGTIQGDLIVGAQTLIINGSVEGDLIAGAQTVIINGTIGDDERTLAAAAQLGAGAEIGGDLVALGASIETRQGSNIAGDLATGSGQALLAGSIGGDLLAGTSALELRAPVGGNVQAYVNITEDTANARPMGMYLNDSPVSIPRVSPGLTLAEGTRINGSLAYTSAIDLPLPADAVSGQVTRIEPVSEVNGVRVEQTPTPAQRVGDWAVASLRNLLTLLLFGLLMGWLFPRFMRLLPANLRAEPITSLGWGAILFAAAFFGAFVIVLVALFLTVAGLGWNIIGLAWLLLTILGATFFLATSYLSKVIVGETIGRWILSRRSPALAEHKIWPMVVGFVAVVLVIALLRFPLLPLGFFGWMLNFLVILFGLGAPWTWGRQLWLARHTSHQQP